MCIWSTCVLSYICQDGKRWSQTNAFDAPLFFTLLNPPNVPFCATASVHTILLETEGEGNTSAEFDVLFGVRFMYVGCTELLNVIKEQRNGFLCNLF